MAFTSAYLLQQILPLILLLLIPALSLYVFAFIRPRIRWPSMVLGALLPWNWGYEKEREHTKKRRVRTRAEQVSEGGKKLGGNTPDTDEVAESAEDAIFPGLVNMSGTHCFMNSTLQALASLSALPPYLLAIRTRAEAFDVPTPVVDALLDLFAALNTPDPSGGALRATVLVQALCTPSPSLDAPDSASSSSGLTASAFWGGAPASTAMSIKASALLATHEHQDAQEFFQLLSESVHEERMRVAREGARDRGLGFAVPVPGATEALAKTSDEDADVGPSPFDGLTATRRACVRCGYTAAIRHFAFDSVQLALESAGAGWGGTSLPALLRAYTSLEVLHDCACRRCMLRATARRLAGEVERLERPPDAGGAGTTVLANGMLVQNGSLGNGHARREEDGGEEAEDGEDDDDEGGEEAGKGKGTGKGGKHKHKHKHRKEEEGAGAPTASRLRRLKTVRKMEARVRRALEAGRIEEEELEGGWEWDSGGGGGGGGGEKGDWLKGVRIERVGGGVCTRQSMLGRPPAILALHINRSVHTGLRAAKNGAHVAFPELLDLAPYTTSGVLNLEPTTALSGRPNPSEFDGDVEVAAGAQGGEECLYRLAAAVCHFGQHAFGHYICYRRAPVPAPSAPSSSSPPPPPRAAYAPPPPTGKGSAGTGTGWLRISDARVDRCGVEEVLAEGRAVFMLYYERVPPPSPPPPPTLVTGSVYAGARPAEGDSAETLRPGMHFGSGAGVASTGIGLLGSGGSGNWGGKPRVVRSVSVGVSSRASTSSSSLSLRSVSPASVSPSPAPVTPRAHPVEGEATVEALVLAPGEQEEEHQAEDDASALPTPPPTPKAGSEPPVPVLSPSNANGQKPSQAKTKKKKKKGKQSQA